MLAVPDGTVKGERIFFLFSLWIWNAMLISPFISGSHYEEGKFIIGLYDAHIWGYKGCLLMNRIISLLFGGGGHVRTCVWSVEDHFFRQLGITPGSIKDHCVCHLRSVCGQLWDQFGNNLE